MSDQEDNRQITGAPSVHRTGERTRVCPTCGLGVPVGSDVCPNDGTSMMDVLASGTLFADKYELLSVVGAGGMGIVYKARQVLLDKQVAVKTVLSPMPSDTACKRFQQEGKAASRLSHPNVISIFDFGISVNGKPYLVMDWVEGTTLADRIKTEGALPLEESLDLFIQVIAGLSHAHSHGVLHRDLKPSNIMLTTDLTGAPLVKIVDFGIAKLVEMEQLVTAGLTQTGEMIGSPQYMSPEQGQGWKVDARSDLYSLGCVMYEALTGSPPFARESVMSTLLAHQNDKPLTLREASLGKEFPESLEHVIASLLAKDPSERYQSANDLGADLLVIKSGGKAQRRDTADGSTKKSIRPRLLLGVVAAIALLIATTCWIVSVFYSTKTPVTRPVKRVTEADLDNDRSDARDIAGEIADQVDRDPDAPRYKLSYFRVTDEGLAPLAKLWKLRSLDLSTSKAGDKALGYVENAPLTVLILSETQVTDAGLVHIAKMKKLESLDLYDTKISDAGLEQLSGLKALKVLNIGGSEITDSGLQNLAPLKLLKNLSLADLRNKLTDTGYSTIAKFSNLTQLNLGANPITPVGINYLANLPHLENLSLARTKLSDEDIEAIAKLRHVEVLDLEATGLSASALETIVKIPTLRRICVANNPKITDQLKQQFVRRHPQIQFIQPVPMPVSLFPGLQGLMNSRKDNASTVLEIIDRNK